MILKKNVWLVSVSFIMIAMMAQAEMADRPQGIKIGQRMTLRPYVNFDFTWDSNQDQQSDAENNSSWCINPHLNLNYKAEHFNFDLGLFYGYRAYNQYSRSLNSHDYGEDGKFAWTTSGRDEKGWSILIGERFQKISEDDDMQNNNGRGLWRERRQINVDGAIEHRFNEKVHADINGRYYYLDYDNDGERYMNLYGWQQLSAGAEIGYVLSKWADLILSGSYSSYTQDNEYDLSGNSAFYGTQDLYSRESTGWTVQGGFQSAVTEKISYRLLVGYSNFSYSDGMADVGGLTYSASANWRITDTWHTMLMASSYYQPSEREYGSANRTDSISWGLAHSMVRNKLNATFDISYRRETREYSDKSAWEYDEDYVAFRLGLDYTINRYLAIYARGEYQKCFFDGDMGGIDRDYDRFRVSVGFRLQY